MGCCNISKFNKNDKMDPNARLMKNQTTLHMRFPSFIKKKEITSIEHFKVLHTDLINEQFGKIAEEYQMLSSLGFGTFGEVRMGIHRSTGIARAIKIINKNETPEEEKKRLLHEDHPNIIKVFAFYQDDNYFYIVSELCTGGELFNHVEKGALPEKLCARVMKQVLSAVNYMHSKNIAHRDLKLENLLVENDLENCHVKIIDFGAARIFTENSIFHRECGTTYYLAPEILKGDYNEKCDLWSCGVILYCMLCGYPPFNGEDEKEILKAVKKGRYDFDGWDNISLEAKAFTSKLMHLNIEKRLTAKEALQNSWLKSYTASELSSPKKNTSFLNALNNLQNFKVKMLNLSVKLSNKLHDATYIFLVSVLTTTKEKEELINIFNSLDFDGDGTITKNELIEAFKKYSNDKNEEEIITTVDNIMDVVDNNGNGVIDYSEFVTAAIDRKNILTQTRLETAFKMLDNNNSGTINVSQLRKSFGENVRNDIWEQIIKEVDRNSDGVIDFSEFQTMMSVHL